MAGQFNVANPTTPDLEGKWLLTRDKADQPLTGSLDVTGSIYGNDVRIGHITRKTTVIANAAVLTLPTIPVSLLAVPGSNIVSFLWRAVARLKYTANYTNIDAAGTLRIKRGSDVISSAILNNAGASITSLNTFLTGSKIAVFDPLQQLNTTLGNLPNVLTYAASEALTLDLSNRASGNLTGGNALNELIIVLYYFQFDFTGL